MDRVLVAAFASALLLVSTMVHGAVAATKPPAFGWGGKTALARISGLPRLVAQPSSALPATSPSARGSSPGAGTKAMAGSSLSTLHTRRGTFEFDESSGRGVRLDRGPVRRLSALIPILMYHGVRPIDFKTTNAFVSALTLPPGELDKQVRYLKERGFNTVSMADVGLHLEGRKELPPRSLVLTFDDGFQNNHQYVLPLLRRHGVTGTFYIITGLIGQPEYMVWRQVWELAEAGMEIGSHTINHPDLARARPAEIERELTVSKRTLEDTIGKRVTTLAYPSGAFSPAVVSAARSAGYTTAVTTQYGATQPGDRPLELMRIRVQGTDTLATFQWRIEQYYPPDGPAKS